MTLKSQFLFGRCRATSQKGKMLLARTLPVAGWCQVSPPGIFLPPHQEDRPRSRASRAQKCNRMQKSRMLAGLSKILRGEAGSVEQSCDCDCGSEAMPDRCAGVPLRWMKSYFLSLVLLVSVFLISFDSAPSSPRPKSAAQTKQKAEESKRQCKSQCTLVGMKSR